MTMMGALRANVGHARSAPFCSIGLPLVSRMRWKMGTAVGVRISLMAASWSVS